MPGTYEPPNLPQQIADLARKVHSLAAQQQSVISNGLGQPVIVNGRIPGSNPSEYGTQVVNPATGKALAFFGEDGSGNAGLFYYNGSGQKLSQYDETGLHFYDTSGHEVTRIDSTGLHVYNSSGTEEVAAGLLNSSPVQYGLAVLPYGGSLLQAVVGFLTVQPPELDNVTSTPWTAFGSPNTVTAEIGPSGQASVTVNVGIATNTANEQGLVGVSTDGGTAVTYASLSSAAGAVSSVVAGQIVVTGLSPGTHTFQLQYQTANDGTSKCSFYGPALIVQPL